jgi:hypothetical protein
MGRLVVGRRVGEVKKNCQKPREKKCDEPLGEAVFDVVMHYLF